MNIYQKLKELNASKRKYRLFSCNCVYSIWDRLEDERSKKAVEIAELFADGKATKEELIQARNAASAASASYAAFDFDSYAAYAAAYAASYAAYAAASASASYAAYASYASYAAYGEFLLEEMFHKEEFTKWKNNNITQIAENIYENKQYELMPILADALEDSGCNNENILLHCRGENKHVRGCWVLDGVLGKQ